MVSKKEHWDTFSVQHKNSELQGKPIYNRGLSHYFTKNRGSMKEGGWEISCFKSGFEQK